MADTPDIATAVAALAELKARLYELEEEYKKKIEAIFADMNERYLEHLRNELTTPPSTS